MLTKTLEERDSAAETSWRLVGCLWALTQVWSVERDVHQRSLVCITNSRVAKVAGKYSLISYTWHVELEAVVDMWLGGK